jgi:Rad3-related DNA helicase
MVGMPYPNIKSPELKEKMDYLNANFVRYIFYMKYKKNESKNKLNN